VLTGTLPGRKPSTLTSRASFLKRVSIFSWSTASGTLTVILRLNSDVFSTETCIALPQKIKKKELNSGADQRDSCLQKKGAVSL
jgi:hypothetical protein